MNREEWLIFFLMGIIGLIWICWGVRYASDRAAEFIRAEEQRRIETEPFIPDPNRRIDI